MKAILQKPSIRKMLPGHIHVVNMTLDIHLLEIASRIVKFLLWTHLSICHNTHALQWLSWADSFAGLISVSHHHLGLVVLSVLEQLIFFHI